MRLVAAALAACCLPLSAQTAVPTEFPPEAVVATPEQLQARMVGKVLRGMPANGVGMRLEYKANGYVFLNTDRGVSDTGRWKIDGSQVCIEWQRSPASGCSEVRMTDKALYVRRTTNQEILALGE